MSRIGNKSSMLVNGIRVLRADELEKIAGARTYAGNNGRMKGAVGPDHHQKNEH